MPVKKGTKEVETCWAVMTPILYKLNSWHKLLNGSHGQARSKSCLLLSNAWYFLNVCSALIVSLYMCLLERGGCPENVKQLKVREVRLPVCWL